MIGYKAAVVCLVLVVIGAVTAVGNGAWHVELVENFWGDCLPWFSYSKSQDATCDADNSRIDDGVVRLWCFDNESRPDSEDILIHVQITALDECRNIVLEGSSHPLTAAVVDLFSEAGFLALRVQVVDSSGLPGNLTLMGSDGIGEWKLDSWNPSDRFIVTDKEALMILPPDTTEVQWSVKIYVYAYENSWIGKGWGHRGVLCFCCWRDK